MKKSFGMGIRRALKVPFHVASIYTSHSTPPCAYNRTPLQEIASCPSSPDVSFFFIVYVCFYVCFLSTKYF